MHISSEYLRILIVSSCMLLLIAVAGYAIVQIRYSSFVKDTSKDEGIYEILNSGPLPIEDVVVRDSAGRESLLSSQISSGKLVTYLPDISCKPCAQKGIGELKSVFGGKYIDNMLIISHFETLRHQQLFQKNFGIPTISIVSENMESFPGTLKSPVSFYCDSLMVTPFYVTDALSVNDFDAWVFYYRLILHRFERMPVDFH